MRSSSSRRRRSPPSSRRRPKPPSGCCPGSCRSWSQPEQEELIDRAVEAASDGTPGRDRKARGLTNLAKRFLEDADEAVAHEG